MFQACAQRFSLAAATPCPSSAVSDNLFLRLPWQTYTKRYTVASRKDNNFFFAMQLHLLYVSRMLNSKPIPVRLTEPILRRLDEAAEKTGLGNRTAVIKLCLVLFLDALEARDFRLPGIDIHAVIKHHDGRTHRYLKKNGNGNGGGKGN
jgi:hypothetical protein